MNAKYTKKTGKIQEKSFPLGKPLGFSWDYNRFPTISGNKNQIAGRTEH